MNLHTCLHAGMPACIHACMHPCLLASMHAYANSSFWSTHKEYTSRSRCRYIQCTNHKQGFSALLLVFGCCFSCADIVDSLLRSQSLEPFVLPPLIRLQTNTEQTNAMTSSCELGEVAGTCHRCCSSTSSACAPLALLQLCCCHPAAATYAGSSFFRGLLLQWPSEASFPVLCCFGGVSAATHTLKMRRGCGRCWTRAISSLFCL